MALIPCPECKRQVSSHAIACPHCGYPLSSGQASPFRNPAPSSRHADSDDTYSICARGGIPQAKRWTVSEYLRINMDSLEDILTYRLPILAKRLTWDEAQRMKADLQSLGVYVSILDSGGNAVTQKRSPPQTKDTPPIDPSPHGDLRQQRRFRWKPAIAAVVACILILSGIILKTSDQRSSLPSQQNQSSLAEPTPRQTSPPKVSTPRQTPSATASTSRQAASTPVPKASSSGYSLSIPASVLHLPDESSTSQTPSPTPAPTQAPTPVPTVYAEPPSTGYTVYITKTGTKYHNANCQHLKKSKIAISLDEARRLGYEACKVCH